MHQEEVNVVQSKVFDRQFETIRNTVVPGVVELGGDPDLLPGNARVTDTLSHFGLVAISQSTNIVNGYLFMLPSITSCCDLRVDVAVAPQQSVLDSLTDLIGSRLPGTKTDGRDLVAGVKGVGLPIRQTSVSLPSLHLSHKSASLTYWVWSDILRNWTRESRLNW